MNCDTLEGLRQERYTPVVLKPEILDNVSLLPVEQIYFTLFIFSLVK